jgi:hypothetical protein
MIVVISAALVGPQRCPLPRATRTVFAPRALMSASACGVRLVYQACAWLTPRKTNSLPVASRMRLPLTVNPDAAKAGRAASPTASAVTRAARTARSFFT